MRRALLIFALWLALLPCRGAETLPPKPAQYFNDYAGVVSAATAQRLDARLREFERDTSNQIVIAVFPKFESQDSVEDFTYRIAQSWKVGQADRRNGAVLFVFIAEHQMFIQVGYGLEGAMPDITAKHIVENEIKPAFKAGNYDAGLTAGVDAMIAATRGEYVGTGRIHGESEGGGHIGFYLIVGFIAFLVFLQIIQSMRSGVVYSRNGRSFASGFLLNMLTTMASSGGGGGFSRGGGSSWGGGGGGGFSGGGGSFGGGGAGGSW